MKPYLPSGKHGKQPEVWSSRYRFELSPLLQITSAILAIEVNIFQFEFTGYMVSRTIQSPSFGRDIFTEFTPLTIY